MKLKTRAFLTFFLMVPCLARAGLGVSLGATQLNSSRVKHQDGVIDTAGAGNYGLYVEIFGYRDGVNIGGCFGYVESRYEGKEHRKLKDSFTYFGIRYFQPVADKFLLYVGGSVAKGVISYNDTFFPTVTWEGILVSFGPEWQMSEKLSLRMEYLVAVGLFSDSYSSQNATLGIKYKF